MPLFVTQPSNIAALLALASLLSVVPSTHATGLYLQPQSGQNYVQCEGVYANHLQGIATNNSDSLYWSFTDRLVKTDRAGHVVTSKTVINHHGDLCYVNGKIYVAVNDVANGGVFNEPATAANSANQWVYEYDASTLNFVKRYAVPQAVHGAGGITYHDGQFLVVGGLPTGSTQNQVFRYSESFAFLGQNALPTGYTDRGIQTAAFAAGNWLFGTYGTPRELLKFNVGLSSFERYPFPTSQPLDPSYGIDALWDGNMLVADNIAASGGHVGRVYVASIHNTQGLQLITIPVPEAQSLQLIGTAMVCLAAMTCYRWRANRTVHA